MWAQMCPRSYLLLPAVRVAACAILQNIAVVISLDLDRHAAVDALVATRNVILIHN